MSVLKLDDLLAPFRNAAGRSRQQLLGVESEKFGILTETMSPVSYDGERCGILNLFDVLCQKRGYRALRETASGPPIAIYKGDGLARQSITLEPGAQLELSGAALDNVHQIEQEMAQHLADLAPASRACRVQWLSSGYHPIATQAQLPWVPKQRYSIMREYFPSVGSRGLDMMRRTGTVQVNLDYHSEEDAMRKLRVALKLAPIITALFAASPFAEGKVTGNKSERARVWLDTDRYRTGLLPALQRTGARFVDYVNWALDVPMYMFKRHGQAVANTGQTFRSFWQDGYQQHRATAADWEMHLATMFPEARLKTTLELRSADAQPNRYYCCLPALCAGVFYDQHALAAVEDLVAPLTPPALAQVRPAVAAVGLAAEVNGKPLQQLASALLRLAHDGLSRRQRLDAQGRNEQHFLEGLMQLCERGQSPADEMLARVDRDSPDLPAQIVKATMLRLP